MTQVTIKRIHRCYSWILAAVLAVLGVLLILSCLDIYISGPRPYSADAIAIRFWRILGPIWLAVDGIIGGIVLNLIFPLDPPRGKGAVSARTLMLRLRKKVSVPSCKKEITLRVILWIVTAHIFVALMIFPAIYFLMPEHFTVANLNNDVVKAVLIALIPAVIGLVLCWVCNILVNASYRREAAIYKQALANGHRASTEPIATQPQKWRRVILIAARAGIVLIAVTFIIMGIFNGGAADVLKKAIAICTECIGLG